jgi:hypothetical protein
MNATDCAYSNALPFCANSLATLPAISRRSSSAAPYRELLSPVRHLERLGQHADGDRVMATFQVSIKLRQVCRRDAGMLEYLFGHDSVASEFFCQFLKS